MSPIKIALLVAVACMVVSSVSAIKCYSCVSGCNDPYDGDSDHEEPNCNYCGKVVTEGPGGKNVVRECYKTGSQKNKCTKDDISGGKTETCYCNTELCNGSGVPAISLVALVAVAVMKVIL